MKKLPKGLVYLFLLGAIGGLLGEGLLYIRAHCAAVENLLMDDFRAVVFLNRGVKAERGKVVGEKLLAMDHTASVSYISPEEGLTAVETAEPELSHAVALLGENPLPGAFEVEFEGAGLSKLDAWSAGVSALPEVREVRYKVLQAAAILQVRFYTGFLTLIMGLAFLAWGLGAAGLVFFARLDADTLSSALGASDDLTRRVVASGLGTALGMIAVVLIALPSLPSAALRVWPPLGWQLLLLAAGAATGAVLRGPAFMGPFTVRGRENAPRSGARLIALVLALVLAAPVSTVRAAGVRSKKKELSAVKERIRSRKKEFRRSRDEEEQIRRSLRGLEKGDKRIRRKLAALEDQRDSKIQKWRTRGRELGALKDTRSQGLKALSEEVDGYRRRRAERSEFYGKNDLWSEAYRREAIAQTSVYLARLGAIQGRVAADYRMLGNQNHVLRARTQRTLTNLIGRQQRLRRTERAYVKAKKKTAMTQAELRKLEESAKAIAALLIKLQRKAKRPYKGQAKTPGIARNSLPWPVSGKVATSFGKKRVPELKTWVISNGIEIVSAEGRAVRPVAPGEVIFAGDFRSYGKVVIVDHGKGLVSIYGFLGGIKKKSGDRVLRGHTLGTIGRGKGGRPLLYFELRQGSHALDPQSWLKKR